MAGALTDPISQRQEQQPLSSTQTPGCGQVHFLTDLTHSKGSRAHPSITQKSGPSTPRFGTQPPVLRQIKCTAERSHCPQPAGSRACRTTSTATSPGKASRLLFVMGVVQTPLKSKELSNMAFILRNISALLQVERAGASGLSQQSFMLLPLSSFWKEKEHQWQAGQ